MPERSIATHTSMDSVRCSLFNIYIPPLLVYLSKIISVYPFYTKNASIFYIQFMIKTHYFFHTALLFRLNHKASVKQTEVCLTLASKIFRCMHRSQQVSPALPQAQPFRQMPISCRAPIST